MTLPLLAATLRVVSARFVYAVKRLGFLLVWTLPGWMCWTAPASTNSLIIHPDFDRRHELLRKSAPLAPERLSALRRLQHRVPEEVAAEFDPVLQAPRWLAARQGFLTGPGGEGRLVSAATAREIPARDPDRPIKALLREHRELFGHGPEVLLAARRARDYAAAHNGLRTVVWEQQLEGIPVQDGVLIANVSRRGELVSLSSQFAPDPATAAAAEWPHYRLQFRAPPLSARAAALQAAADLGAGPGEGDGEATGERGAWSVEREAHTRLVWLPMSRTRLRLCWAVELSARPGGHRYLVLVDARDGRVHLRRCRTFDLTPATYRVFTSDSPSPFSPGHPHRSAAQPPRAERALVTLGALDPQASPIGWIRDGENETRGNNVEACLDQDGDDWPDLPRVQGAPFRVFDFPLDLTRHPANSSAAAVVQLFYWCNWMHDRLYQLGFTEAAGNFQKDNFGRGGQGNDAVLAEAQDGSGFNNANFSTTRDGAPPRLQMYLFNGPSPWRDAALDAEVILHEYTHGLTDRMVGGGAGLYGNQGYGLSEGWSDFYALALLSEAGDDLDGAYAYGGYLTYQMSGLKENYYFGIRRYPYTTDLGRDPLTLGDVYTNDIARHPSVPRNPTVTGEGTESHRMGEVWCSVLWDARASLVRRSGFAEGNELILQLVTDSLRLLPPNPNFIQARDAILIADEVNHGGAHRMDLWDAFAKRGWGVSARAQDNIFDAFAEEAFDAPDALELKPAGALSFKGPPGGPFTPLSLGRLLANLRPTNLAWSATVEQPWLEAHPSAGVLAGTAATNVTLALTPEAALLPAGIHTNRVVFLNASSGMAATQSVVLGIGQPDLLTEVFEDQTFDLGYTSLVFAPDGSTNFYRVCRARAGQWPVDPGGGKDLTLVDDAYRLITLADGAEISLFGTRSNQFFIGSNGDVVFSVPAYYTNNPALGLYSQYFHPELSAFFERLRVGALYADLNPGVGGTVSWKQLADRVVFTYQNVPEYGTTNTSSFQAELGFDGVLRFTYLDCAISQATVGLSRGAGVTNFFNGNLSGSAGCFPSLRVEVPANATEGDAPVTGQFFLAQPAAQDTPVELASTDPAAVAVSSLVVPAGQAGAEFPLVIRDDSLLNGTRSVAITARAANYEDGFALIEIDDNESATLSVSVPPRVSEGDGLLAERGSVTLSRLPDGPIAVQLQSSQPDLVRVPATVIVPERKLSAPFDLRIVDDTEFNPPRTVEITAQVRQWTPASAALEVEDNEIQQLYLTVPEQLVENGAPALGRLELGGALPTNLVVQLMATAPALLHVPARIYLPAGSRFSEFELVAPDNLETNGNGTVRLLAEAPGFVGANALVRVRDDELPPAPVQPDPPDGAGRVPTTAGLAWSTDLAAPAGAVAFDVYCGTNPAPTMADFQGSTRGTNWPLGQLGLGATYYWQVVARRGPYRQLGPLWRFATVRLDHFEIDVPASPKPAGEPFEVTVTARDETGQAAVGFTGPVALQGRRPGPTTASLVISEVLTADPEQVEFMNVSGRGIELTGWQVALYDWVNWPEPAVVFTVPARTFCQPGEVFVLRDIGRPYAQSAYPLFLLGTNVAWNEAVLVNPIAILLRDAAGNLVDFMCAHDADPAQITRPLAMAPEQWMGGPVVLPPQSDVNFQRTGDRDRNGAADWVLAPPSLGETNAGLAAVFVGEGVAPISIKTIDNFTNGVWAGRVVAGEPAPALWLEVEDGLGHRGASERFEVEAVNDLSVRVEGLAPMLRIGGQYACALVVSNSGPAAATGVTLWDKVSAAADLVAASATQGTCALFLGRVFCDVGTLAPGASATVTLTLQPRLPGCLTNTVTVAGAEPESYLANNNAQAVTVMDYPWLFISGTNVVEGNEGFTNAVFQVRLSDPSSEPVTVNYATADGSARAGSDYLATNGVLSFPPGTTNAAIVVPVFGDRTDESNETFFVFLSQPVNAVLGAASATAFIVNDDALVFPDLTITSPTVVEGDEGATEAVFEVALQGPHEKQASCYYLTEDVTASAGQDYLPLLGRLVFPVGVTSQVVRVPVLGDRLVESDETFVVKLCLNANPENWRVLGACTILDDDGGRATRFEWGPLSPVQSVGAPFPAQLSALDGAGRPCANFDGAVAIQAGSAPALLGIGAGTNRLEYPFGASFAQSRLQVVYPAGEIGRPGRLTALALEAPVLPGQVLSNWVIRLKHTARGVGTAWDNEGLTVVYRATRGFAVTGWVNFVLPAPFDYDGVEALLVDFTFNNTGVSRDGLCRATATNQARALAFRSDGAFGDPLDWSETNAPPPLAMNVFPNVRFTLEWPLAVPDGLHATLTNGFWAGLVQVLEASPDVALSAVDAEGRTGRSGSFQVLDLDSDGDGMPDAWEARHGLRPKDPSDASLDADGDGVSNLSEFLAGTDPMSPASCPQISRIEMLSQGIRLTFPTVAGKRYQVESAATLPPPAWEHASAVVYGTGSLYMLALPMPSPNTRFYRVNVLRY